jgi:hypothetical protein
VSNPNLLNCRSWLAAFLLTALSASTQAAGQAEVCKAVPPCQEGESGQNCLSRLARTDTPLAGLIENFRREQCRLDSVLFLRDWPVSSEHVTFCGKLGVELPATAEESKTRFDELARDKKISYQLLKKFTISSITSNHAIMTELGCPKQDVPDRLNERHIAHLPDTCICDFLNKDWIVKRLGFTLISWQVPPEVRQP